MTQRNNDRSIEKEVHAKSLDIFMVSQYILILSQDILMPMDKILELQQMLRRFKYELDVIRTLIEELL